MEHPAEPLQSITALLDRAASDQAQIQLQLRDRSAGLRAGLAGCSITLAAARMLSVFITQQ